MKNKAIQHLISIQHDVPLEDVSVEFISSINYKYEFKVNVRNNDLSVCYGFPRNEVLRINVESSAWSDD